MNDSQQVDLLLQRSQQAIKAATRSVRYQDAMKYFWNKKYGLAIEGVSAHILNEADKQEMSLSYRLWIECLAAQESVEGLRLLAGHLLQMAEYNQELRSTLVALSGLAYLEADDFGKSRLVARCVVGNFSDPYVLELIQRLRLRAGFSEKYPIILRSEVPIVDIFHWDLASYALSLQTSRDEDLILRINKLIKYDLKAHLVTNVIEYHHYLEEELYAGAAVVADLLHQDSPDDDDFKVFQAFAYFEDGDYPSARKILTNYVKNHPRCDFRILGLLGRCYGKLGDTEKAIEILDDASTIGAIEGGVISDLLVEAANLRDELTLSNTDEVSSVSQDPGEINNWLIKLTQGRYFDLMFSPENVIDRIVLPLGARPRIGDYVFFAASEYVEKQEFWNVVALFKVETNPVKHGRFEFVSVLKLVSRLPLPVPIDIDIKEDRSELDQETLDELGWDFDRLAVKKIARKFKVRVNQHYTKFPKGYPYRYGLYHLDEGALEIIEKAVEKQAENLQDRRHRYLSKRPTA